MVKFYEDSILSADSVVLIVKLRSQITIQEDTEQEPHNAPFTEIKDVQDYKSQMLLSGCPIKPISEFME